jgi:hypothetical protein
MKMVRSLRQAFLVVESFVRGALFSNACKSELQNLDLNFYDELNQPCSLIATFILEHRSQLIISPVTKIRFG